METAKRSLVIPNLIPRVSVPGKNQAKIRNLYPLNKINL